MQILRRFTLPIILGLSGGVICCWAVGVAFGTFTDDGYTFLGPGDRTVRVKKSGDYVLWHQSRSIVDGQFMSVSNELPMGAKISVVRKLEGSLVSLRPIDAAYTSTKGTTFRVAMGYLTLDGPGEYDFLVSGFQDKRCFYLDEDRDYFGRFLSGVWAGVFGILLILGALVSSIYVLIRARRGAA